LSSLYAAIKENKKDVWVSLNIVSILVHSNGWFDSSNVKISLPDSSNISIYIMTLDNVETKIKKQLHS